MAPALTTRTVYGPGGGSFTYKYDPEFYDPELEDQLQQSRRKSNPRVYAEVQWWDASSIYVLCPFCLDIHSHGFTTSCYSAEERRRSHCNAKGPSVYILAFPFDSETGEAWYSIDRERALFVTAGADPRPYFARFEEDELLHVFQGRLEGKRLWSEAKEMRHISEDSCSLKGGLDVSIFSEAMAAAVEGKVKYLREYLENSPEAEIFLHGVEKYEGSEATGRTTLQLAACERHPNSVALLLLKGADPNAQDAEGRTPLMEAALWGRLDNVQLLLNFGANRNLVSVRRGQRLRAVDFAREWKDNSAERNKNEACREDVMEMDSDRREIVHLLDDPAERPRRGGLDRWSVRFSGGPSHSNQLTLVAHFDRPTPWKTVGFMYRSSFFPPVASMSGWTHEELNTRISGEDWTDEVLKLCRAVGFSPAVDVDKDDGVPGRFYACHTEKQLIAHFVSHHVFLDSDPTVENLMKQLSISRRLEKERERKRPLMELRSVAPPVALREADITVCRQVCSDCLRFVEHVNRVLGLELVVRYSPVFE